MGLEKPNQTSPELFHVSKLLQAGPSNDSKTSSGESSQVRSSLGFDMFTPNSAPIFSMLFRDPVFWIRIRVLCGFSQVGYGRKSHLSCASAQAQAR